MKNDAKSISSETLLIEIEQLKKQLALHQSHIESLEVSNQKSKSYIAYLEAMIETLQFELARQKRWHFGAKREQMNPEQLSLFDDTRFEDQGAIDQLEQQIEQIQAEHTPTRSPKSKPVRQSLPEHLERVEILHLPEVAGVDDISQAPDWRKISVEIKEEQDLIPAKFFVNRHRYPKYQHQVTGQIVCALRPARIIEGGYAANGLLSWVVSSKYQDHLPLNRIEQIALREGVVLPKSTLAEWVGHVGIALKPLVDALKTQLVSHRVLQTDETPVKQLCPKTPHKHHQSYLWVYRTADLSHSGNEIIIFDYQASRAGCHPQKILADFSGHLMVDDYAGYKALFTRANKPIIELGCFAHARRKFYELTTDGQNHPLAHSIVLEIAKLYAIESRAKILTQDERQQLRKQEAIPILTALKSTLDTQAQQLAPKSLMAKAVHYSLKRWASLTAYAQTGHLPIDNNLAENAVRPIALGRKNWLFVGSEAAGQRQAVIISLLATAKANGLDPARWLKDTLDRLPTTKHKDLHTLMPLQHWQPA